MSVQLLCRGHARHPCKMVFLDGPKQSMLARYGHKKGVKFLVGVGWGSGFLSLAATQGK